MKDRIKLSQGLDAVADCQKPVVISMECLSVLPLKY